MDQIYQQQCQSVRSDQNMLLCMIAFLPRILCQSLAYMEQFTFISAMTWQTQIGHSNVEKLRGELKTYRLQVKHVLVGYGIPALLSATTATVELVGQKCAIYKPRFGER